MKILMVQKEGGISGSENYLLQIIAALLERGLTVDFLRLYSENKVGLGGEFVERLERMGVRVFQIRIGFLPRLSVLRTVSKIVRSGRYTLVHTHLIHADLYLSLVKRFFDRRMMLVSTKHGFDNDYLNTHGFNPSFRRWNLYYTVCRVAETNINRSFAISQGLRELFCGLGISRPKDIDVIHYGFDFDDVTSCNVDHSATGHSPTLVVVGRLRRYKGHRYVLECLPRLMVRFPTCKLIIVGSGYLEQHLRLKARELGIADYVEFTGYKTNAQQYMAKATVIVVPSVAEGFGVVLLEAFNNRKPVVAFDVSACNEIIENGVSGLLVTPYSTEELTESIISLLADPDRSHAIGKAGYERLKSHFSRDRMLDETLEFYRRALRRQDAATGQ